MLGAVSLSVLATVSFTIAGCNSGSRGGMAISSAAPPPTYAAITGISYPVFPTLRVGTPLAPILPVTTGGFALSYDIDPFLPPGLIFDMTTGMIWGTPAQVSPRVDYTVTAENPSSSESVVLSLEVFPPGTVVSFLIAGSAAPEGGLISIDFELSPAPAAPLDIEIAIAGSALAGADFVAATSPITVPAGATVGSIDLAAVDDADVDPGETVQLEILPSALVLPASFATHVVTILDGDGPPLLSFPSVSSHFAEGAGSQGVEIYLFPPAAVPVEVGIAASGSSTVGEDWLDLPPTVSFAPGEAQRTLTIEVVDDLDFEGNETLVLTLVSSIGSGIGAPGSIAIEIEDDDQPPEVGFTESSITVLENGGSLPVMLALSALSGVDVFVGYELLGSASTPADYSLPPSPLRIPAGSLSAMIPVAVVADALSEATEFIQIRITSVFGAQIGATDEVVIEIVDVTTGNCSLSYAPFALYLTAGSPMPTITPTTTCGGWAIHTVVPALPDGIVLDPATGVLSGTPLAAGPESIHVITATGPSGSGADQISFRIAPSFSFALESAVVPYDPALGEATFTLGATLTEFIDPSASPQQVQGLSFGLRIAPGELVADAVAPGSTLAALNGGLGPDFFAPNFLPDGVTLGVVFAFVSGLTVEAVPSAAIAEITFSTVPAFLLGNATGTSVEIPFDPLIGTPPVANIVVVGGHSTGTDLVSGWVDFLP